MVTNIRVQYYGGEKSSGGKIAMYKRGTVLDLQADTKHGSCKL